MCVCISANNLDPSLPKDRKDDGNSTLSGSYELPHPAMNRNRGFDQGYVIQDEP